MARERFRHSFVALVVMIECCFLVVQSQTIQGERPKVLQLVAMVSESSSGTRPTQDWERGLEILPGACVAVQEVNRNTNVLPGYQLELVELITEGCSDNLALVQLVQHLVSQAESEGERESQTVGIIGPLCNDATSLIATVAGHPGISLVQIAATPFALSNDRSEHPYLFQMLPLSQSYINTVLGLMKVFGWNKLAVLCTPVDEHSCRAASTFEGEARKQNVEILYNAQSWTNILDHSHISDVLTSIRESRATIVLAFLPPSLASEIVCAAYREGLAWPEYGWILPGLHAEEFEGTPFCDIHMMALATEGLLLLQHSDYQPMNQSTQLVSGQNHTTHYSSDTPPPMETANRSLQSNVYASVFYDSVWAFALALNKSNLQFHSVFPHRGDDTVESITGALLNISLTGSTGLIEFDSAHNRMYVPIQVTQVRKQTSIIIAHYNPLTMSVSINFSKFKDVYVTIPSDEPDTVYVVLSVRAVALLAIFIGLGTIFTSAMLFLYIYYRNEPEVKATSTTLSLFIFAGCYFRLCGSALVLIFGSVAIRGSAERIASCQLELWLELLGRVFIIATLAVRLLRIYRVFNHFGHTGKFYSDKSLATLILSATLVPVSILVVWAIVDVYKRIDVTSYRSDDQPPYYEVKQRCASEYARLWEMGIIVYFGLVSAVPMILAFKTRKISRVIYKDTKTVFTLLPAIVCVRAFSYTLSRVFEGDPSVQSAIIAVTYTAVVYMCQVFLFLPKTSPPLLRQLYGSSCTSSGFLIKD